MRLYHPPRFLLRRHPALRRELIERIGAFDERLGLPSSSGEEIDYVIRAVDSGARIEYDPGLVVLHPRKAVDLAAVGARDGASIGYILRKHRYPPRMLARMFLLKPAANFSQLASSGITGHRR